MPFLWQQRGKKNYVHVLVRQDRDVRRHRIKPFILLFFKGRFFLSVGEDARPETGPYYAYSIAR
jgi:hypothetical protein